MQNSFSFDVAVLLVGYFDVRSTVRLSSTCTFFRDALCDSNTRLWTRVAANLGVSRALDACASLKRRVLFRKLASHNWSAGKYVQCTTLDFGDQVSSMSLAGENELLVVKISSVMESKGIVDCELDFSRHQLSPGVIYPAHEEQPQFLCASWRFHENRVRTFIHPGSDTVLVFGREFAMHVFHYPSGEFLHAPHLSLLVSRCRQHDDHWALLTCEREGEGNRVESEYCVLLNPTTGETRPYEGDAGAREPTFDPETGQVTASDGHPLFSVDHKPQHGTFAFRPKVLQLDSVVVALYKKGQEHGSYWASVFHRGSAVRRDVHLTLDSVCSAYLCWRGLVVTDDFGATVVLDATATLQTDAAEHLPLQCVTLDANGKWSDAVVQLSDSCLAQLNEGYYVNENSAREFVVALTPEIRVIMRCYSWGELALALPGAPRELLPLEENTLGTLLFGCHGASFKAYGTCIFYSRRAGVANDSVACVPLSVQQMTALGLTPWSTGRVPCSPVLLLASRKSRRTGAFLHLESLFSAFNVNVQDMQGNNIGHLAPGNWELVRYLEGNHLALHMQPNDSHLLPAHYLGRISGAAQLTLDLLTAFCDVVHLPPLEHPLASLEEDLRSSRPFATGDWAPFLRRGLHTRAPLRHCLDWCKMSSASCYWDKSGTWELYQKHVLHGGSLLDLGCGTAGAAIRLLDERIIRSAVCVDCHLGALASARATLGPKGLRPVLLVLADIGAPWPQCPYAAGQFDTVTAIYSLQHVWDTQQRARHLLRLASAALKTAGRFLVLLPGFTERRQFGDEPITFGRRATSEWGHIEFVVTLRHLVAECALVGLRVKFSFTTSVGNMFAMFEKM